MERIGGGVTVQRITKHCGEMASLSCEVCGKTEISECWSAEDCVRTAVNRLVKIEDILGDEYDIDRL